MCGIAGIIRETISEDDHQRIKWMTDSLIHRGPDGEGFWSYDDQIVLGHRRLCIIDRASGAQPMHYMDRYTILFNGAIYNYVELREQLVKRGHRFRTHSDTEVILASYAEMKEACLQTFDGMFAFVIYDREENTLFCARDRFGEKPFYYHYKRGESFIFASEMKALWAAGVPRSVRQSMLYNYFMFGYVENIQDKSKTFFEDVLKLPAAHYAVLDCNNLNLHVHKYWDLNWQRAEQQISLDDAKSKFQHLFTESIKRRLRSDVQLGSSLSGGLDSSAVVTMIKDLDNQNSTSSNGFSRCTFSAQFPGYEKDESRYQQIVVDSVHAKAYFTYPSEDSILAHLDRIMYHQEEPFHSSSVIAQYEVYKLACEKGVTVLLDGQGADEVLGGYKHFFKPFFKQLYCQNKKAFTEEYKRYIEDSNAPQGIDFRFRLEATMPSQLIQSIAFTAKQWKYRHVLDDLEHNFKRANKSKAINFYNNPGSLNEALYVACTKMGLETLLRYADRNSMANGREVRLPFLSHDLVEFLFTLPAQYKIHHGWTKYLLRISMDEVLPKEITWRKDKTGFEPPQKAWMENKQVQQVIRHYKQVLVNNKILKPEVLEKQSASLAADEKGDNSWQYFMAGKLLTL
jgi:asparagine synthase (glutamine-hydrolysing)